MNPNVYVTYWGHQFDQPVGVVLSYPNPISTNSDLEKLRGMLAERLNIDERLGSIFEIISWQRLEDDEDEFAGLNDEQRAAGMRLIRRRSGDVVRTVPKDETGTEKTSFQFRGLSGDATLDVPKKNPKDGPGE